jgi:hypothetical protein
MCWIVPLSLWHDMIKLRRLEWVWNIACMEDMKYIPNFVQRMWREETSWKYDIDERTVLKHIVQKFTKFRVSPSVKFYECSTGLVVSQDHLISWQTVNIQLSKKYRAAWNCLEMSVFHCMWKSMIRFSAIIWWIASCVWMC